MLEVLEYPRLKVNRYSTRFFTVAGRSMSHSIGSSCMSLYERRGIVELILGGSGNSEAQSDIVICLPRVSSVGRKLTIYYRLPTCCNYIMLDFYPRQHVTC